MAESIIVDVDGPIATVTLNRPEVRNAFNLAMWQLLAEVMEDLGSLGDLRAIVVRGAGDRAFAAGADVNEFPEKRGTMALSQAYSRTIERALGAVRHAPQPVIAQIRGFCVGGGCELATVCDIRIASEDAKVGITPAKIGLVLGFEEVQQLVSLVGPGVAKDLLFTGRLMDASEAKLAGYFNYVVPVDRLEAFTREYVDSFLGNAPISIEGAKRSVNACTPGPEAHAIAEQLELHVRAFASGDIQEGVAAFREKRKPRFKGD